MANGQQQADDNFVAFCEWRDSCTDDDFRQIVHRSQLNRSEIAKECRFSRSVTLQNPRIVDALLQLEEQLRLKAVLPPVAVKSPALEGEQPSLMRQAGEEKERLIAKRMSRLEQENAVLRAENAELKRQFEKFSVLQKALSFTGRIPR
jgi:hypothetical protein